MTNYAKIWGMRSLSQFIVCFWMKSSATNYGTPFSYNVLENELLIHDYKDFCLWVGGQSRAGKLKFNIRSEKTMGVYDEDGR